MAIGDVLSAVVDADGWHLDVTLSQLSTGGTYNMGFGPMNDPSTGSPKVVLTVTRMGFDNAGNPIAVPQTIYGTIQQRKVVPNQAQNNETISGSDVIVRLVLSDCVYAKDKSGAGNSGVDITCVIGAGFYTQGGIPNNARSSFTVTNNSTVSYTKVVANWSWPGFQLFQGSKAVVRTVGYQGDGREGRPVRAWKCTGTDGTTTQTVWAYDMKIDRQMGDAVPIPEYIFTFDNTVWAQGATLTFNFVAYPWIGDSTSLADTSTTGQTDPYPYMCPKTGVCDKNSAYGVTVAYVDSTSGVNGSGVATDISNASAAEASPYLNIGAAAVGITNYNTANRSRSNCGAGIIYLKSGNHVFTGSAITGIGATPATWITIMPAPGLNRSQVALSGQSTASDLSDRVKIQNVTITSTTLNTFSGCLALWFDQCDFNTTNTGLCNSSGGVVYATRCKVTALGQGMRPNSTVNNPWGLVRGNTLTGFTGSILCYCTIGNLRDGTPASGSTVLLTDYNGMLSPAPAGNIIAYNKIMNGINTTVLFECNRFFPNTFGTAFVQNVLEHGQRNVAGNALADFASSDGTTTNTPADNLILLNSTMVGERCFVGYNDQTALTKYRRYWSRKNNAWGRSANKGDTFTPNDANRVGGWMCTFGVRCEGEYHSQNTQSLPGNFYMEFVGIKSWQPATNTYGTVAQMKFRGAGCIVENPLGTFTSGSGNGNYRPAQDSPLLAQSKTLLIPYDIDGNPRSAVDAAGAYAAPKGAHAMKSIYYGL